MYSPIFSVEIIGWVGFTLSFVSGRIRHKFFQMSHISSYFSAGCDPLAYIFPNVPYFLIFFCRMWSADIRFSKFPIFPNIFLLNVIRWHTFDQRLKLGLFTLYNISEIWRIYAHLLINGRGNDFLSPYNLRLMMMVVVLVVMMMVMLVMVLVMLMVVLVMKMMVVMMVKMLQKIWSIPSLLWEK